MKLVATTFWAAAVVSGCVLTGVARAEDLGSAGAARGAQLPSKLDQEINQATNGSAGTSSSDTEARINDLEATRTAIDQKRPPAVSLSVSGWVNQEVQYNVK